MAEKSVGNVLGSSGRVKSASSNTRDIFFFHGDRFSRLIERDGKPLQPDEE